MDFKGHYQESEGTLTQRILNTNHVSDKVCIQAIKRTLKTRQQKDKQPN